MTIPNTIAIDGPAASGKSTLGKMLADHFGYIYFDTGVLYRALTHVALQHKIDPADADRLVELAQQTEFVVMPATVADGRQYTVLADNTDVTWMLRSHDVEEAVSQVSTHARVREALRDKQRQIGENGRVVMAGRDIGAIILPHADLKIYLDASVAERAQRRTSELQQRGEQVSYSDVLQDLSSRDAKDAVNTFRTADAIILQTDGRTPAELMTTILELLAKGRE